MSEQIDVPQNEAEADELLAQIEAPTTVQEGGEVAPADKETVPMQDFAFTVGGKEIKATRDQVIQWAQMGYTAPNQIRQLTQQAEDFKKRETAFKELQTKYGEIDSYAKQNPQWLQFVIDKYKEAQGQRGAEPNAPVIQALEKKIQELEGKTSLWEQNILQETEKKEDAAYLSELDSVKKQYPKVDFDSPDHTGKSLEYKVLEHAAANGIGKFTTAFRDFYHDELMKMGTAEAKEKVVQDRLKAQKSGIIGVSPTSQKGLKPASSIKSKSYNDLAKEALEELGA